MRPTTISITSAPIASITLPVRVERIGNQRKLFQGML